MITAMVIGIIVLFLLGCIFVAVMEGKPTEEKPKVREYHYFPNQDKNK